MSRFKALEVHGYWSDVAKAITHWENLGFRTQHVYTTESPDGPVFHIWLKEVPEANKFRTTAKAVGE